MYLEGNDDILFAMIQLQKYTSQNLPLQLRWQIYAFIRMEWPKAFPAVHFVFVDNDVLISHVAVCWKMLPHEGHTCKTYGLASVLTFPDHRNQGYGLRVVTEAKKYLEQTDGDLVLFHSDQVGFYEKAGFEWGENVTLLKGKPDHQIQDEERPYMLFLSEKAKIHRSDFSKPVYFGEEVW
jgi:predicted acetyltransferase